MFQNKFPNDRFFDIEIFHHFFTFFDQNWSPKNRNNPYIIKEKNSFILNSLDSVNPNLTNERKLLHFGRNIQMLKKTTKKEKKCILCVFIMHTNSLLRKLFGGGRHRLFLFFVVFIYFGSFHRSFVFLVLFLYPRKQQEKKKRSIFSFACPGLNFVVCRFSLVRSVESKFS